MLRAALTHPGQAFHVLCRAALVLAAGTCIDICPESGESCRCHFSARWGCVLWGAIVLPLSFPQPCTRHPDLIEECLFLLGHGSKPEKSSVQA